MITWNRVSGNENISLVPINWYQSTLSKYVKSAFFISRNVGVRYCEGTGSGDSKESGSVDSGTVINYYYGIALIYEKEADKIRVYHFDHLGSTRNITDEKGNICYRFRYGTFGELLSVWDGDNTSLTEINKDHPVRFLYNGALGVVTDNNELLYMRQRYYNTDIKRFINQDTIRIYLAVLQH